MIQLVLFLSLAVLGAALLLLLVRDSRAATRTVDQLERDMAAIDMAALGNLLNPADCEFLLRELGPAEFRRVQRMRTRVALAYLRAAAQTTSAVLRYTKQARTSELPEVANAARHLANSAMAFQINAFLASWRLRVAWIFPSMSLTLGPGLLTFDDLKTSLGRIHSMQARQIPGTS
jgi:hypothetical protein